jgi:recombinational DNA repair ATPase RecF
MILGATRIAQTVLGRPLLLLLDDPAAELDEQSLGRLTNAVVDLGSQVIATSREPDRLRFPGHPAMFHVEQGRLRKTG